MKSSTFYFNVKDGVRLIRICRYLTAVGVDFTVEEWIGTGFDGIITISSWGDSSQQEVCR